MHVTFLYPDVFCKTWHHYQYGIASLSAVLKKAGHTTDLIHLDCMPTREAFLEEIHRRKTNLLAVSSTSGQWRYVREPLQWVREEMPEVHLLAGGIHPTLVKGDVFESAPVDAICLGEAEETLPEYVNRLAGNKNHADVGGFWVKLPSGEIRQNPMALLPDPIDALPMADHDLFDFRDILRRTGGEASLMATRGCPYRCSYCSNEVKIDQNKDLGENMRYRSASNVLDEVEHVRDVFGAKSIYFIDDIFTMNRAWLRGFCDEYGRRGKMPFKIQIQVKTVDYERLAMMRDVGLYQIVVGVESGDERIRKKILNKHIAPRDILKVFQDADSLGIETAAYNMIGIPGETEETIRNSIEFNKKLNPDRTILSIFTPFPGTSLYDESRRLGLIEDYTKATYFDKASFLPIPGISKKKLEELYDEYTRSAIEIAERKHHRGYYDFVARMGEASVTSQHKGFVYLAAPRIDSIERKAVCCHPYSELRYEVPVQRGTRLKFGIGMAPDVWDPAKGEGVLFRIEVQGKLSRKKIFERYLDPKRNFQDRHWLDQELDLSAWAGRRAKIIFSTRVERSNDFCSSYWAEPHLVAA
ncbi:MAG: radical SAM protein [Bdellovibrionota bacterium]